MTSRIALVLPVLVALVGVVPLAHAADDRVLVVRTSREPACLDLPGVARAVGRHAGRAAVVVGEDEPHDPDAVTVRIVADGAKALVGLSRGERLVHEELAIEPCATLPEQIGAFVAGAVPALHEATAAPVPTPAAAAAAVVPGPEQRRRAERAAILAGVLDETYGRTTDGTFAFFGWFMLGSGPIYAALAFMPGEENTAATKAGFVTAGLIVSAGATGALVLGPRSDAAEPLLRSTAGVGLGLELMMLGRVASNHDQETDYWGGFVLGAAYMGAGLTQGIYALARPPRSSWSVRQHMRSIGKPEARDQVSDAQLAAIERDVAAASGPPGWLRAAPFALAGMVGATLAAVDDHEKSRRELLVGAGVSAITALAAVLSSSPIDTYHRRLRGAGLDLRLAPTPTGAVLGLSGRF